MMFKYSARFATDTHLKGSWDDYAHADKLKEVIRLAAARV